MPAILSLSHKIEVGYFPNDPEQSVSVSGYDEYNCTIYQVLSKGGYRINHIIVTQELVPFMFSHGFEVSPMPEHNVDRTYSEKYPILTSKYKNIIGVELNDPIDNKPIRGPVLFHQRDWFLFDKIRKRPCRDDIQLYYVSGNMSVGYRRETPIEVPPDNLVFGEHQDELKNENCIALLNKPKN